MTQTPPNSPNPTKPSTPTAQAKAALTSRPSSAHASVDPVADQMLAAARAGSNRAWAALLNRLDPQCRELAHLVLGGHSTDTVLLASYLRAFRAKSKGPTDATVFLLRHVWTSCGNEIRRTQRRATPGPGRKAELSDLTPRFGDSPMGQALAQLRPEERAIWALRVKANMPSAAVSQALGVGLEVVEVIDERVRLQVTQLMDSPTGLLDIAAINSAEATPESHLNGSVTPPPPSPDFWAQLGQRLKAERDAPLAIPNKQVTEPRPRSASALPPVAMQKRAPTKARRDNPDVVDDLAQAARRQKPKRTLASSLVKATAGLVVTAAIVVALGGLFITVSKIRSPLRSESTADTVGKSMTILGSANNWSADVSTQANAEGDNSTAKRVKATVFAQADGSFRIEDTTISRTTTFNAAYGELEDMVPGFPPRHEIGVGYGGATVGPPIEGTALEDLAIAARTLAGLDTEKPTEATLSGTKVLRMSGKLSKELTLLYWVDAATYTPVRIEWTKATVTMRTVEFSNFILDGQPPQLTQNLPENTPVDDKAFTRTKIIDAEAVVGYQPVTPDFLPDGFKANGVAVNSTTKELVLRYELGPQQIMVTTLPWGDAQAEWKDPFERGDRTVESQAYTVEGGSFRGAKGRMVTGPRELPSIWVTKGKFAVAVSGDVSESDLKQIMATLRQA